MTGAWSRAGGLAVAIALATPAAAQETGGDLDADGGAQITVYGWMAGASGDFTPFTGGPTIAFDSSFGEVLEDLDKAFFASTQFRRDRFVVAGDVSYASLSRDGVVSPGIPASGKVAQLAITALAGARVTDSSALTLDLLAGARLWNLDGRIEVSLAGVSVAPDKTFVDPIVAARFNARITPRLSTTLQADVGGFGVASDFTYQLVGTLNYRIGRAFYFSAGWRHLALDYDDAGTAMDGSQTGPLIGFTYRF
ncbi:hypothetical protein [Novosphingobium sp.]|uniref:hypothetical protein n=1 Tax=Novosphingobium sp. TaxID=1874826 RepID=UPI002607EBCE|nr:hypothetical protein [Novosphingobium sp.]